MICLDKLKIITSINYIENINTSKFQTTYKDEVLQCYKYKQNNPCLLLIMINYLQNELVIEFTSKVLKDKCINLINKDNIHKCLDNINKLNLCNLNVDKIINDSDVTKCDVTKDISHTNIKELENHISTNLTNYKKWFCKSLKNGFSIEKNVSTPRNKVRLTIYNKEEELQRAINKPFLSSLSNSDEVTSFYKDKIRFELNINTMAQIREFLNTDDNQLMNVLSSNTNPILTVIDNAINENIIAPISSNLRERERELLIEKCNYDLKTVEQVVRSLSSKNTSIKRVMEPYKDLYHRLHISKGFDIRGLLA